MIHFTIQGDVPSKSNQYRIVKLGKRAGLAKTSAVTSYEKSFALQLPTEARGALIGSCGISIDVFFPNRRKDLDGSFKVILDCLQKNKVIENDRKVLLLYARRLLDKENPRIHLTIKPIQDVT